MKHLNYTDYLPKESFSEFESVEWFSQCGRKEASLEGFNFIAERSVALTSLESIDYENYQLERQNDITKHLTLHHQNEGGEWNNHSRYIQELLAPTFEKIEQKVVELEYPKVLIDSVKCVKWRLLPDSLPVRQVFLISFFEPS